MARTPSNMVDLGSIAPKFNLINTVDDKFISSDDCFSKKGTLIMFICNHCPFVIHVIDEIIKISNQYTNEIDFIAISSNDVINYPDDAPELMKKLAIDKSFNFPYLYDENQDVAKAYDAACTPDFFLYNDEKKLIYRGQLDDSRPGNEKSVDGKDLRNALDCLIKNVKNNKMTELKVHGLFIAIGHDPATSLFKDQLKMDKEGYLITKPDSTETNIPGVFAAGDVKDKIFRQAVTAAGMGCMSALEAEKFLSKTN